ncbi:hypothetical protein [Allobranchiibius sp. CTAmp26]|uniref:hypothetical protein n=1 Tax=Allobranchiibius sp. CTAmp26 TaxID=2815214 RepID=UPI001AA172DC|nr:hypothetical protein [Allobranchiibius sp. CTAmp26]MBO1756526.1 hypothetical protein [Allobranchiibius sp. CTAmp26]
MSNYTSNSVQMQQQVLARAAHQGLMRVGATIASTQLAAAQQASLTGTPQQRLETLASVLQAPGMSAAFGHVDAPLLARAGRQLTAATTAVSLGRADANTQLQDAVSSFYQLVDRAVPLVQRDERAVVGHALTQSMRELGYQVHTDATEAGQAVAATRGDTTVLALVEDGGTFEIDFAAAGDSCETMLADLRDQLSRHGVLVEATSVTRHDNPGGGTLIQLAARQDRSDLVHGALQHCALHRGNRRTATTQDAQARVGERR